jgi:HPt (histidine-containing phosphotransfer) domain-containing protein|tara:strand:+ start:1173 stop:1490 length:318 start_codon:yes stop_codon:yes gene_type:complete
MAEPWFDQDFWDDNFGDFDQEDLDEILVEAVTDIEDLLAGVLSDDLDLIAKNAHKIVSTCGNFGYLQCAELAAHVEQKAKIRDLSEEDKNRLIDMIQRVVADLKK